MAKEGASATDANTRISEREGLAGLNVLLRQEFKGRYAGSAIDRGPLRLTVRLKGAGSVPERIVQSPLGPVRVGFQPGAAKSVEDLRAVVASNRLRTYFPDAGGMGVDAFEGLIYVGVVDAGTLADYRARQTQVERDLGIRLQFRKSPGISM